MLLTLLSDIGADQELDTWPLWYFNKYLGAFNFLETMALSLSRTSSLSDLSLFTE
jgi:hypothetical protein